ncbi:hypothetical protein C5167_048440 [Papaver somniferum]|uniref:Uncharacterized protein n=1 Tax=Papaver somniferum TaxID=3469 RepID=A0A4Y7KLZ6_PAPSO|nr:hypothetical protein C5167_048440 [Papaver somniferum]
MYQQKSNVVTRSGFSAFEIIRGLKKNGFPMPNVVVLISIRDYGTCLRLFTESYRHLQICHFDQDGCVDLE